MKQQRAAVVAEALTWQGTPYHHRGAVKGAGVDCAQLPLAVFKACGLIPADFAPAWYPHDWHMHRGEERWLQGCETFMHRIECPPRPGDLALYRFGRTVSHGAIVIEWPLVLHSYLEAGAVILDDAEKNADLSRRFVGFWSFWGAE